MLYMIIISTRTKDMFRVSLGTQTFSTVSARIWNALIVKFNVNVLLTRLYNYQAKY